MFQKYCQGGFGNKELYHHDVVRTWPAPILQTPQPHVKKTNPRRCFGRGCPPSRSSSGSGSIKPGAGRATWCAGSTAKWKCSKDFKRAVAKHETNGGILLSPGPWAVAQVAHPEAGSGKEWGDVLRRGDSVLEKKKCWVITCVRTGNPCWGPH